MFQYANWNVNAYGIYLKNEDNELCLDANSVVAVHDGLFHADELLGLAIIEAASRCNNLRVIRTREPMDLASADIRLDVGGKYAPADGDFDHHQWKADSPYAPKFVERWIEESGDEQEVTSAMAACGLVYYEFGMRAIKNMIKGVLYFNYVPDTEQLVNVWNIVLRKLIYPVSSHDVGVISAPFECNREISLSQCVRSYNSRDFNKFPGEQVKGFEAAREFMRWQFKGAVEKAASQVFNLEILQKATAKAKEEGTPIMVLKEAIPWKELVLQNPEPYKNLLLCIMPGNGSSWNVLSFPGDQGFMSNRCLAPEKLRALSSQKAIIKASNGAVTECTFVHASGFLGACLTFDGAMELAQYWVNQHK